MKRWGAKPQSSRCLLHPRDTPAHIPNLACSSSTTQRLASSTRCAVTNSHTAVGQAHPTPRCAARERKRGEIPKKIKKEKKSRAQESETGLLRLRSAQICVVATAKLLQLGQMLAAVFGYRLALLQLLLHGKREATRQKHLAAVSTLQFVHPPSLLSSPRHPSLWVHTASFHPNRRRCSRNAPSIWHTFVSVCVAPRIRGHQHPPRGLHSTRTRLIAAHRHVAQALVRSTSPAIVLCLSRTLPSRRVSFSSTRQGPRIQPNPAFLS